MKRWLPDLFFVVGILVLAGVIAWQQHLLQRSLAREHEMFVLANRLDKAALDWQNIAKDWELAALNYKAAAETFRQATYFCVTPAMGDAPRFELSK